MLYSTIDKPKNANRYVVGDIHGCANTFKSLINNQIKLKSEDHLYLLGDYIDRGSRSAEVIDFIFELHHQGFNVFPLMGNHEQNLLEEWYFYSSMKTLKKYDTFIEFCEINNTLDLLTPAGTLKTKYYYFLSNLKFYFDLGDFLLVHAGFDFSKEAPFDDYEQMIWIRNFIGTDLTKTQISGKRVVIGHTIYPLADIMQYISAKNLIIPLDNGCFMGLAEYQLYQDEMTNKIGNLCAWNLDTEELFIQPCID